MFLPENGGRQGVDNTVIFLTDKISQQDMKKFLQKNKGTKDTSYTLFGSGLGINGLTQVAVNSTIHKIKSVQDLDKTLPKIIQSVCPGRCSAALADIVFILDSSTSVTDTNFKKVLAFVKDFLSEASIDSGRVRVGVVIYSTDVTVEFHLNRYRSKSAVLQAIDNIPYIYGSTNTYAGLHTARTQMFTAQNGDRADVPNIIILLTDGVSNINALQTIPEAEAVRAQNIHIYAVGIGLAETTELDQIASSPPSENSFTVQDFNELEGLKHQIFDSFCPGRCSAALADIVFILDSSTSVTDTNFKKVLAFVKDFLSEASIDSGRVRVGVVIYSTDVTVEFHLNRYRSKSAVLQAIDNIPYIYGSTNTYGGLHTARTQMFTAQNGDRADVPNIIILLTDGVSNINALQTIPEAEAVRAQNIHIYAVGIGLAETTELDQIASSPPSENSFTVQDFNELEGLKHQIFDSFCPGKPQITTLPTRSHGRCSAALADIVFILDSSTSVTDTNFKKVLAFVKDFLSEASIDSGRVRVGVVIYSTDVTVEFHLNRYRSKSAVLQAIDNIPYIYGSTNTYAGLHTARTQMFTAQNGDRADVPNIIILLTDGVSNINALQTIPEAEAVRAQNIHIYAVGIGLAETTELDQIASSPPSENSFTVQDFNELEGLKHQIFDSFCPGRCSAALADIVFILDSSTSVTDTNFKKVLAFVKDFLSEASIDSGRVRVGVVIYSTDVTVEFHLNRYRSKSAVLQAIDNIPYIYGSTNTYGGLHTARTQMFTAQNGDRADVPNIIILLTDGVSNINALQTIPEAEAVRAQNIHIYAVGIGLAETTELDQIASSPPSENSFTVQDFNELEGLKHQIFDSFCPGKPQITTLPTRSHGRCSAALADIVFILDSSTSVTDTNFKKVLAFVKDFLSEASIDSGRVRVGVVIYSTDVTVEFHLNRYRSKSAVLQAIDNIPYIYGSTNTYGGLHTARTQMFTAQNGDRADVPNIIILLTDGVSNINALQTIPEAEAVRAQNIHIYAVGIGLAETTELDQIASSPPSENSFTVQDFNELEGLKHQIFDSFCPGKPQITTLPTRSHGRCSAALADIVFILDSSTSVTDTNFKKVLAFVKDFLSEASIDSGRVRVGVVIYSTDVTVEFHLNRYRSKSAVLQAIDNIPYIYGSTNTYAGLHTARTQMFTAQNGDRADVPNIIILLTDGVSNINALQTIPEAEAVRAQNIHIYAVGIGLAETTELDQIASSPPSENSFTVQDFNELEGLKHQIFDSFCPGKPQITTLPTRSHGRCSAALADIVFILDSSTSVTDTNFKKVLAFVKDFLSEASIDSGRVRVGVVIYSTDVTVEFHLNRYRSKSAVLQAIDNIPYIYGSTNTYAGLHTARTQMFTAQNGDRADVPNIIILLTDGVSNINALQTIPEAEAVRAQNIHIYAVGIGLAETTELDQIASSPPSENSFTVQDFNELEGLKHQIFDSFCPGRCSAALADIVFILDSSTSVTDTNFKKVLAFVKDFLSEASIDSGRVRVGVVIYSTDVTVEFHLNRYRSKSAVLQAIDNIPYIYGSTNTYGGLHTARTQMFTAQNGDRADVPNIIILLTDGVSNINALQTIPEAEAVRAQNIHIYAVGIGLAETTELDQIASSPPSENSFTVQDFNELEGLKHQIFDSFCPGKPQITTLPTRSHGRCSAALADIVFILDSSTSVTDTNFKKVLAFVKDFLSEASIDSGRVRVGVVIYSTDVTVEFHLNRYRSKSAVLQAIDNIPYIYGSTNTYAGLHTARTQMFTAQNGDRADVPNIIILLTDGVSNINALQTIPEAEAVRAQNIHIYAVGIGLAETTELDQIASSPPSENSFTVQDFNELEGLKHQIFDSFCPGRCSAALADIVFILDSSTSVTDTNFKKVLAFVKDFLSEASIDSGRVRVGVVIYSTDVTVEFHLNRYRSKSAVLQAIDNIPYIYGSTNTYGGLHTARTQMFTAQNGDRADVPNIIILLTDGVSNINALQTIPEAEAVRAQNIHIYAVGIGLAETTELDQIASSPPSENSFTVQDFNELEGLKHQIFDSFCPGRCSAALADIVFILDSSTSVTDTNFKKVLAFVKDFLSEASIDSGRVRVGVVIYSTDVTVEFHLNRYRSKSAVLQAIDNIPYIYGSTNTYGGLHTARTQMFTAQNGDRADVPNIIILLTDGVSNINALQTIPEAEAVRAQNIHIYAVGIGLAETTELDQIASSPPSENSFTVQDFNELEGLKHQIFDSFCPGRCSAALADIVFILDSSTSVTDTNFKKVLAFVKDFLSEASIDSGRVRVGVVIYSTDVTVEFHLNRYRSKSAVLQAIDNIPYIYGSTNTYGGLHTARTQMFTAQNGDRADVPNIIILLTDGVSNINALQTIPEAEAVRAQNIHIYAVGIGLAETTELDQIASSPPSENSFTVQDFNELEGLKHQIFDSFCPGRCSAALADIVFILDSSTSVTDTNFKKVLAFVKDFLSEASIDSGRVRVGVVIYSTDVTVEFHLNRYRSKSAVLQAIDNIPYIYGSTNTYAGLHTARTQMFTAQNGDRADVPNIIILLTDGVSNINALQTIPEAEAVRAQNIHIYAVGIGLAETTELDQIASSPPSENSFTVQDFNELEGLKHQIFDSFCPGRCSAALADIVFILDSSTSVTDTNFKKVLAFVKDFLSEASIDSGRVRVGVVIYSTDVTVEFHLNRYRSKSAVLQAIDNIPYIYGSTNTYAGLHTARTQMFTAQNGDRADVPNIIILLTDGVSNINALQTIPEAEAVRAQNIHIYAVGIGLAETTELDQIASSPPSENSFTVQDFNELEGLKHQIFDSFCPGRCSAALADIVFILDSSTSVTDTNFKKVLAFVKDFLSEASIDSGRVRVGVVIYSTDVTVEFHLNRYRSKSAVLQAIDNIPYIYGSTNTYAGLHTARTQMFTAQNGDRADVPNIIILLTDGVSNINALQTIPEAEAVRAQNIHIYAVGIGLAETTELDQIASSPPSENSFTVQDFNELEGLKHQIFDSFCPGRCSAALADIVFILDSSTSVTDTNFKKVLAFVKDFLSEASIDSGRVRVGVVIYSTDVTVEFHLNRYRSKSAVLQAIDNIPYIYGSTNTYAGLHTARTQMFTAQNGDRADVPNIIILLTDGVSNINALQTIPEAEAVRAQNIHIYAVGIGLAETTELDQIASSPPSENSFTVQDFNELEGLKHQIFDSFCPGRCSAALADIVFILDSSTSVTDTNFKKVLAFVKDFLSEASIDSGRVRVGVVIYSTDVTVEFHLNRYRSKSAVLQAIDNIPYIYGSTNTYAGLHTARTQMFTAQNGDRADVPNIIILLTDGVSNINALQTIPEAEAVRAQNIHIYAVGIGLAETTELDQIASSPPSENSFTVQDFNELEGLKHQIFDSFCPGKPQITTLPTRSHGRCSAALADIVFILDSSTSVTDTNFKKVLAFVKDFLSEASIDSGRVRVGVVIYSTDVTVEFHLNRYRSKSAVLQAIDNIPYIYGSTNTYAGLHTARTQMFTAQNGDRADVPNIIILLTDGVSNINALQTIPEAEAVRAQNIHIYAVGIGLAETTELNQIASSPPSENSFTVQDFNELEGLKHQIFDSFCPGRCSAALADIVFILDSSTSVTDTNFKKVLAFVKDFLSEASIDSGRVRVGVVIYSTDVTVEFHLNRYRSKSAVLQAIDNIPYIYGSTNTYAGLHTARTQMFTAQNGDRADVPNIIILLTDGVSNINALQTIPEAEAVRAQNIHIYAVGIGLAETTELNQIASSPPSENSFTVQDFNELEGLKHQIFDSFCPGRCSAALADIVFILDSSTSVTDTNFKKVLAFVKDFLSEASIDSGRVRVGVVIYSTDVTVEFHLNRYRSKSAVLQAIDNIPYIYGSTNTYGGLHTARTQMFTAQNGDRADVPNIIILLTDGVSNINALQTIPEAEAVRAQNIHIYAVGIGLAETTELDQIASSPPSENSFTVQDFNELEGLKHQIFDSFCPGKPQITTLPTRSHGRCSAALADIVFILDSSTSVTDTNFKKVLAFVKDFLSEASIDSGRVRVGVVIYSTDVTVEFHLNRYRSKSAVLQAIDNIPYIYGSTNTYAGLHTARTQMFTAQNGDRADVPNIIILLTDGVSNINALQTIPEAEAVRAQNIHIYAVGIGLAETTELDQIASSPPSENSFTVQDFNELEGLKHQIFDSFCPGKPQITTLPTRSHGRCSAALADIVFILDSSTSVTDTNFKKVLAFVKDFLSEASIDSGRVRVGVVIYSTDVTVEFHLNRYRSKSAVLQAIDNIPYIYGSTNTYGGLHTARTQMFTAQNGDRADVPNIIILLTDGVSNINALQTIPEAEAVRAQNIHIYAVGIGLAETTELDQIASSPPSENSFTVQDFNELEGLKYQIFDSFCPGRCSAALADIVFILDSSTSVTDTNFKKVLAFVKDFLSEASIDSGRVRVGVVIYSTDVTVEFHLNRYRSKSAVLQAIDNIPYIYGSTNTYAGLHTARTQMFTAQNGDRADVPNIIILLTDGVSNINALQTIPEAEAVRAQNIHIYAVGIGLAETTELDQIASSPPSENSFTVQDFNELEGLKHQIFDSFCPGKPQITTLPTRSHGRCSAALADIVFILDSSTSVTDTNFKKVLAFVKDFLSEASIDSGRVRVGVVIYSTDVTVEFHLNRYRSKSAVLQAIDNIPYIYGSTNTYAGLHTARTQMFTAQNGDRADVPNIIILLTDGVSNINALQTIPEAEAVRAQNIHIYAVGIGLAETTELDQIASSPPSENSFTVQDFNELQGLKHQIFDSFCPGKPQITTLPTRSHGRCSAALADIVFILDSSTSVTDTNFKKVLAFVKDFLSEASIDSGRVRVGVVIYSTDVTVEFHLNRYRSKSAVLQAIDNIPYIYGSTNTYAGLHTARTQMFTAQNGDRADVPNIIILLTDGVSNINALQTIPEAEAVRAQNIHIYAVGIGLAETTELDQIASSPPSENSFTVQDFNELEGLKHQIFDSFCPGMYIT
ncbi:hypothetical protein Ahia01_001362400 [Argonauta hians]